MKVRVDDRLCQGHAMCTLACPELFELSDEDGHAFVRQADVPPELSEKFNVYGFFLRDPNGYLLEFQTFLDPRWKQATT